MLGSISWIKSNQINANSVIDLMANQITLSWNPMNTIPAIPGKPSTQTWSQKMSEIDTMGVDNPVYTIRGDFDTTKTTNNFGSVIISIPIIASLMVLGSPFWFYDQRLIVNPAGSCQVMVSDLRLDKSSKAEDSLSYQFILTETGPW
jgi:hypothetical protein